MKNENKIKSTVYNSDIQLWHPNLKFKKMQ